MPPPPPPPPPPPTTKKEPHPTRSQYAIPKCESSRRRQDFHRGRQAAGARSAHRAVHRRGRHRRRTSGGPRSASSTPRWKRPMAANARSAGWRSSPAKRPSRKFNNWLPDETVEAFREFLVGIKGPLTTPVGGGIRSLNVALRQMLDLYVCLRPVPLVQGRALAGQASGKGRHGHFPREHRGHLRRHRVRGRAPKRSRSSSTLFKEPSRRSSERSVSPNTDRHRHQAGLAGRHANG